MDDEKQDIRMTEKEKMLKGLIYDGQDKEVLALRTKGHKLSFLYNKTTESQVRKRRKIIKQLFPNANETCCFQGPLQVDYGCFVNFGTNFYANFNLVILDTCPVTIGNNVYIGPNGTIVTAIHPLHHEDRYFFKNKEGRVTDKEYGAPITIGNDCWIASNVTICGGVKIGNGCVIGANSVVTHDIPDGVLAAGNPCKVIRPITDADRLKNKGLE